MARVVVLGGCGAVGSWAVRTLAAQELVPVEVVIGDRDTTRSASLVAEIGPERVSSVGVDVTDPAELRRAIDGADVVLNCVGPFYESVETVLDTVLDAGLSYVDVCDDVDVTLEILGWHERAKRAGVTALIGMGSSPGATNVLARLAADTLLAETDAIDIFHAHGGEPFEGPGVVGHRLHCMSIPIPMFLDGELRHVSYFGDDGIALRQTFSFPVLGDDIPLYPYPHPEQVTLPRYLDVQRVTNKGTVLPSEYYDLTRDLCQLGLASEEPVSVGESTVVPREFAIAYIIRERERILRETRFGSQRGCCSVVVTGRNARGEHRQYRFHMASGSQALGEGTGIPAAVGVLLLLEGKVTERGVLPPEACVDPADFVATIPKVMQLDARDEGGDAFGGVIVEKVDGDGHVTRISM